MYVGKQKTLEITVVGCETYSATITLRSFVIFMLHELLPVLY